MTGKLYVVIVSLATEKKSRTLSDNTPAGQSSSLKAFNAQNAKMQKTKTKQKTTTLLLKD